MGGFGTAFFDNRVGHFGGYRVIIVPDVQGVRRTWKERLLSWPWRPWVTWKTVPTHWPETLKDGVLKSEREGVMYMRAHTAAQLKQFIEERPSGDTSGQ
jgi:hypothetical protein